MNQLIRSTLVLAGAVGLAAARPPAPSGSETLVVTGGPYAGTYQARADRLLCFYAKDADRDGATFLDEKANTAVVWSRAALWLPVRMWREGRWVIST